MIRRVLWPAAVGLIAAACIQVVVAPTPSPAPTWFPTPTPTTTPTPTPTSTPTPTPTPTPIPPQISAETAQGVVRAYFEAVAANDVDRTRALTTGQARQVTEQLVVEVERQTRAYGATPQFRLDRLDLGPTTVKPLEAVVHTRFELATGARVGPFAVAGPPIKGDADITVVRTAGELQISRIDGQFVPT